MGLDFRPSIRRLAIVAIPAAILAFPAAASAATPTPAPTPAGFRAHAHATLTVTTSSNTITGNVAIAMAQRANVTRIDILSVKSDTMPLPPIAFSAVVDQSTRTITVWNEVTKRYYVQVFAAAAPMPSATPKPTSSTPFVSPLAGLDVMSMTLKLTGHTVINDIATTGLAADLLVAKKGETATTHIAADAQIVDDFAFVPMTFNMTVEPAGSPTKAALAFAVDDLLRGAPPPGTFAVPTGYTKSRSVLDVIMSRPPTAAQLTH
jgi:hypothetical protein